MFLLEKSGFFKDFSAIPSRDSALTAVERNTIIRRKLNVFFDKEIFMIPSFFTVHIKFF
jgi:hypothetical protein